MHGTLTSKIEAEIGLLERHVSILKAVMENEPIGIIRLSEMLKLPQHKVRYSLRILEEEGLLDPSVEGAMTTKKVGAFLNNLKGLLGSMQAMVDDLKRAM